MPGRVGYNGFSANRHEGDGTTPAGTFGFVYGFGNRPAPGMHGCPWRGPNTHSGARGVGSGGPEAELVLVGFEGRRQPLGHPALHPWREPVEEPAGRLPV